MMEFEDSGIPKRRQCMHGQAESWFFLKMSSMICLKISFLMASYGMFPRIPLFWDWPKQLYRFGRDNFQEAAKIAHRMDSNKVDWKGFKYMVFDIPTSRGNYSERYNQIRIFLLPPLSISSLLMHSLLNRRSAPITKSQIHIIGSIYIMWRNRSSWEDISGYHGSRRRRNHLARSFSSLWSRSVKRIPQTQGITFYVLCFRNTYC